MKGNHKQNTSLRMGENIWKWYHWWRINIQPIYTSHRIQHQKNSTQLKLKMDRRIKQIFFQMGNADDQHTLEKMLNITDCQGNAHQNYNEISSHTCQNGYHQKEHK